MKYIITHLILLLAIPCYSQENTTIRYYDSLWNNVEKSKAYFYTEYVKNDSLYSCFSYWINSGKLKSKSVYRDSNFVKPAGLMVGYYENGMIEDSIYYDVDGNQKNQLTFTMMEN